MIRIVLDTNFLLLPHREKIDVFHDIDELVSKKHEFIIPLGVIEELGKIGAEGKGEDKIASRVALQLIEKKDIKLIEGGGSVDDFILELAQKDNIIVCTRDMELVRKLRKLHTHVISTKKNRRLSFI